MILKITKQVTPFDNLLFTFTKNPNVHSENLSNESKLSTCQLVKFVNFVNFICQIYLFVMFFVNLSN